MLNSPLSFVGCKSEIWRFQGSTMRGSILLPLISIFVVNRTIWLPIVEAQIFNVRQSYRKTLFIYGLKYNLFTTFLPFKLWLMRNIRLLILTLTQVDFYESDRFFISTTKKRSNGGYDPCLSEPPLVSSPLLDTEVQNNTPVITSSFFWHSQYPAQGNVNIVLILLFLNKSIIYKQLRILQH